MILFHSGWKWGAKRLMSPYNLFTVPVSIFTLTMWIVFNKHRGKVEGIIQRYGINSDVSSHIFLIVWHTENISEPLTGIEPITSDCTLGPRPPCLCAVQRQQGCHSWWFFTKPGEIGLSLVIWWRKCEIDQIWWNFTTLLFIIQNFINVYIHLTDKKKMLTCKMAHNCHRVWRKIMEKARLAEKNN